jgi:hypothetical protein
LRKTSVVRSSHQTPADDLLVVWPPHQHRAVLKHQRHRIARAKIHPVEQSTEVIKLKCADHDTGKASIGRRESAAERDGVASFAETRNEGVADVQPNVRGLTMDFEIIAVRDVDATSWNRP